MFGLAGGAHQTGEEMRLEGEPQLGDAAGAIGGVT